uniref:Uncharacterized protein n=1 Tax=Echeneis naucrates TaxID=173247 RepID=A0A665WH94_ECHNA
MKETLQKEHILNYAPCHTSRASRTLLQERNVQVLRWQAQSLHMVPNGNWWWIIKRSVSKHKPKHLEEMKQLFKKNGTGLPFKNVKTSCGTC